MKSLWVFFTLCLSLSIASETVSEKDDAKPTIHKLLNPCKGTTVWLAPEKEVALSWPTYGDLSKNTQAVVLMPGEFEITFSPTTSFEEAQRLGHWMTVYDSKFAKPLEPTDLNAVYITHKEYGSLMGRSFLANSDNILALIVANPELSFAQSVLAQLIVEVHKMGANRMYMITEVLPKGHESIPAQAMLNLAMKNLGFENHPFGLDLDTGTEEKLHTLRITQSSHLEGTKKPLKHILTDTQKFEGHDLSYLSTSLNFMLRDAEGTCLGGICASFQRDAVLPHADVSPFILSDSVRHSGFGQQLMTLFELYVRSQDLNLIRLDTCDFQAPKFYMKNGFRRIKTLPHILVGHQGESYGMQTFIKCL